MGSFYVTTPIYYINDVPHLGTAYTTVAADVLARYHRLRGEDTRFLTGTDEHGLKIQRAAEERSQAPSEFADGLSATFKDAWPKLHIAPDDFIRTTEARHKKGVQELWRRIEQRGDLYLGHYEGLYCVRCEAYYTEKDLEGGKLCPIHKAAVESVKEESYFFRLSKYTAPLLELYANRPEFVRPATRRNEVVSFVSGGLQDLSVSRTTFAWGVPVPNDPRHVMYVWFDALSNYWTALQGGRDEARYWPPNVQLVGKDIIRFHCVYWPAFLLAAGFSLDELPRTVFAHGFLTYNGHKMSKSLRNTISPVDLARAFGDDIGADVVRYGLMRSIAFGQDGDFSVDDLLARYAADLGNTLGNLLNRVLPFADEVPRAGEPGPLEARLFAALEVASRDAASSFDELSPTDALGHTWTLLRAANEYVDQAAPWAAKKSGDAARLGTIVATLVRVLETTSVLVAPVLPRVSELVRAQLGLAPLAPKVGHDLWPLALPPNDAGRRLAKGAPIFPRFDKDKEAEIRARFAAPPPDAPAADAKEPAAPAKPAPPPEASASKATIAYDDFAKLDLRVGLVVSAERVKKKDKLLDLRVDVGEAAPRRIIAGIAASYAPEELVGKRVVVLSNLAPRDFGKGLVSEGMLLAAEGDGLRVVTVDADQAPGSPVR